MSWLSFSQSMPPLFIFLTIISDVFSTRNSVTPNYLSALLLVFSASIVWRNLSLLTACHSLHCIFFSLCNLIASPSTPYFVLIFNFFVGSFRKEGRRRVDEGVTQHIDEILSSSMSSLLLSRLIILFPFQIYSLSVISVEILHNPSSSFLFFSPIPLSSSSLLFLSPLHLSHLSSVSHIPQTQFDDTHWVEGRPKREKEKIVKKVQIEKHKEGELTWLSILFICHIF